MGVFEFKEYSKSFYESTSLKKCRESYLSSQQYICERCNDIAKLVHHKEYITPNNINDLDITLSFDNLEALCQECHNKEHHQKNNTELIYFFDERGNLIYTPHK